jgi:hypothetical protein
MLATHISITPTPNDVTWKLFIQKDGLGQEILWILWDPMATNVYLEYLYVCL